MAKRGHVLPVLGLTFFAARLRFPLLAILQHVPEDDEALVLLTCDLYFSLGGLKIFSHGTLGRIRFLSDRSTEEKNCEISGNC